MSDLGEVRRKYIFFYKSGGLPPCPAQVFVTPGIGANSLYSRYLPTFRNLEDQVTDVKKVAESKPSTDLKPIVQVGHGCEELEEPSLSSNKEYFEILKKVTPTSFPEPPFEVETEDYSNQTTSTLLPGESALLGEPPAKKSRITQKSNNFFSKDLSGSSDDSDDEQKNRPFNWQP